LVMLGLMYAVMRVAGFWWAIPTGIVSYFLVLYLLCPLNVDETVLLNTLVRPRKA
jgi:hypothetical protein